MSENGKPIGTHPSEITRSTVDLFLPSIESAGEVKAAVIEELIGGSSIAEIAAERGVRPLTIVRWMEEPETKEAIEAGSRVRNAFLRKKLQSAADSAINTVQCLMDESQPARIRLDAAKTILDRVEATSEKAGSPSGQPATPAIGIFAERLSMVSRTPDARTPDTGPTEPRNPVLDTSEG